MSSGEWWRRKGWRLEFTTRAASRLLFTKADRQSVICPGFAYSRLEEKMWAGQIVAGVACVGQRLKQETPFFEVVTQNVLHFICHHITIEPSRSERGIQNSLRKSILPFRMVLSKAGPERILLWMKVFLMACHRGLPFQYIFQRRVC